MKIIPLTKGAFTYVDDSDFDWLTSMGNWCLNNKGYAVQYKKIDGNRIVLYMHRLIMDAPKDLQVDHINRDRLDNRRENLRFATRSQNQGNKGIQCNNTSTLKGVVWRSNRWEARIRFHGVRIYLGRYRDAQDAALAYDAASRLLFEEFAGCNYPDRETPAHILDGVKQRLKGWIETP